MRLCLPLEMGGVLKWLEVSLRCWAGLSERELLLWEDGKHSSKNDTYYWSRPTSRSIHLSIIQLLHKFRLHYTFIVSSLSHLYVSGHFNLLVFQLKLKWNVFVNTAWPCITSQSFRLEVFIYTRREYLLSWKQMKWSSSLKLKMSFRECQHGGVEKGN